MPWVQIVLGQQTNQREGVIKRIEDHWPYNKANDECAMALSSNYMMMNSGVIFSGPSSRRPSLNLLKYPRTAVKVDLRLDWLNCMLNMTASLRSTLICDGTPLPKLCEIDAKMRQRITDLSWIFADITKLSSMRYRVVHNMQHMILVYHCRQIQNQ